MGISAFGSAIECIPARDNPQFIRRFNVSAIEFKNSALHP
jgi:hypothetical protein